MTLGDLRKQAMAIYADIDRSEQALETMHVSDGIELFAATILPLAVLQKRVAEITEMIVAASKIRDNPE